MVESKMKMNDKEKIIHRVYTDEKLEKLILSLLGVYKTPCSELADLFKSHEKVKIPDTDKVDFDEKDLGKLPDIKLNFERFDADTSWVLSSEERKRIIRNRKNVENIDERLATAKNLAKKMLDEPDDHDLTAKQEQLKKLKELNQLKKLDEQYKCDDLFITPEDQAIEMLQPSHLDEYTNKLQKAIDTIYPNNSEADLDLIPVTILLPNSYPQEGDELDGKYSYWEFINIKNEDNGEAQGFQALAEDPDSFYGLRLFLVFKALGLAKTNQGEKNLSKIFFDLINSTPLAEHFTLLSSKKSRIYQQVTKELESLEKKLIKLEKKEKTTEIELNEQKSLIEKKRKQLNKMTLLSTNDDIKSGCYYSLPIDELSTINNQKFEATPDAYPVLPTLSSDLYCPLYTTNRAEINKGKPSPLKMNQMRFMLAYLFPMTSGTAITFYIKKEDSEQNIAAPLLILPETWNKLGLGLKNKNPKVKPPDVSEKTITLIADKLSEVCSITVSKALVENLFNIMIELGSELLINDEDHEEEIDCPNEMAASKARELFDEVIKEVPKEQAKEVLKAFEVEITNSFSEKSYEIHARNLSKLHLQETNDLVEFELPKLSKIEEELFRDECFKALHDSIRDGHKEFDRIIPPISDLSGYDARPKVIVKTRKIKQSKPYKKTTHEIIIIKE